MSPLLDSILADPISIPRGLRRNAVGSPNERARQAVFQFICACASKEEVQNGVLASHFFRCLARHKGDVLWRIEALSELTLRGREVECFMPELGQLLLQWIEIREAEHLLFPYLHSMLQRIWGTFGS